MSNTKNLPRSNKGRNRQGWGATLGLIIVVIGLVAAAIVGGPLLLDQLRGHSPTLGLSAADTAMAQRRQAREQAESQQLSSAGWVDEAAGVAHIPINQAIALVAERGLPVGSAGLTVAESSSSATGDFTNVNYNDDILPIMNEHCAECHGDDEPEEGLILTNYKDAMAGSFYGAVIKPGAPDDSYLVELVATGQMPKRGADLSAEEIATIVAWIEAGAPEAGSAEAVGNEAAALKTATVDLANVSFQNDVLPLFNEHCAECHSDDEPEEGLVLTSYKDVMAGSFYGSVIKPNDVEGSYLVELVATGQMPKRGADLTQTQVDTIIAWVEAGAPDN